MQAKQMTQEKRHRGEAARFLRFCVVGSVGFVTDASLLMGLVHGLAVDPILARVFSFGVAVLLTFELNRHWAFGPPNQHLLVAFASYMGIQGVGFLCNFAIYTIAILTLPAGYNGPLFALVVASGVALIVNYAGLRHIVFGARPHAPDLCV